MFDAEKDHVAVTPRQDPLVLNAGALTAVWEKGRLLNISAGGNVLVSEVYFALRDENWGTIPYQIIAENITCEDGGFTIVFQAKHRQGGIAFSWNGTVTGTSDARITYSFDGVCESSFLRNRIGFCVLHPADCSAKPCCVEHSVGGVETGMFPEYIAPHQPFFDMSSISYSLDGNASVKVSFLGDIFEMEDQRNWTDASFKTYCTPLGLPFPVKVETGDVVSQQICIALESGKETVPSVHDTHREAAALHKGMALGCEILQPMTQAQMAWIQDLQLDYLRYDWHREEYLENFDAIAQQVHELDLNLCVAVFLGSHYQEDLLEAERCLQMVRKNLRSVILYEEGKRVPSEKVLAYARTRLAPLQVSLGSGTDAYFTQLNREPIDASHLDFVTYSNNPQVHAFDEESILSTVQGQIANVESCQHLYPGKPIQVGPITMKIRWNPDATSNIGDPRQHRQSDPRQNSLFAAAWFLKSVTGLCMTGAVESGTYFETSGPRGLMSEEKERYPLYYAFWALRGLHNAKVDIDLHQRSLSMRLCWPEKTRYILCNLTPKEQFISSPWMQSLSGVAISELSGHGELSQKAFTDPEKIMLQGYEIFVSEQRII